MSRFSGTECSGRDDRRCFSENLFNWEWDVLTQRRKGAEKRREV